MIGLYALSFLLFLPLTTCSPLLDREEPGGALVGPMTWADVARGHRVPWGSARWRRTPPAPALLLMARELLSREQVSFNIPLTRREDGQGDPPNILPADGEKAPGLLATLAEELHGYSRKKGGFSFRFGRG